MPRKFVRRTYRVRKSTEKCLFCVEKKAPDYKDISIIQKYVTDRGKIIARVRTGICQKHQRHLSTAIKRARHLALMPFTPHT